nr:RNA-directed DNA polymerase, eukaryota [Tanacetum cinerariifolium]
MSGAHPPSNPNFKNLQNITSTIYITNFPLSLGSKDLWNHCNKYGAVVDVYIAKKLLKIGRRFAFVRFLRVSNNESLINDLNTIWIGSYHLYAAMARFDKHQKTSSKQNPNNPKPSSSNSSNPEKKAPSSAPLNPNKSYVNILKGNSPDNVASQPKNILKAVSLEDADLIDTSGTRNVLLAKVRDANLIPNINIVLNKEGFYNFQCKYIGGLWLWIEFDSNEACQKLQSNIEMSWYFTQLKLLYNSFGLDERVVWMEISGLPLKAWTPSAFKKIVNSWGSPLFIDDDPNETVSTGRVCIKTRIQGHINEFCIVNVLGKTYNVYVKEFAGWAPDIKETDSTTYSNSEMDKHEKHDEKVDDNVPSDNEEGEIPNNDDCEWEEHTNIPQGTHEEANHDLPEDHISLKIDEKVMKDDPVLNPKSPGLEAHNSNGNSFSSGGPHLKSKQASHFSSAPPMPSRNSKSQSKSFGNQGSMIEAFISSIEIGKVLGYDMEGCKNDLKKFIDSIGASK